MDTGTRVNETGTRVNDSSHGHVCTVGAHADRETDGQSVCVGRLARLHGHTHAHGRHTV